MHEKGENGGQEKKKMEVIKKEKMEVKKNRNDKIFAAAIIQYYLQNFFKINIIYRMIIIKDLIKYLLYKRLLQGMKHRALYIIFLCMLKIPNLYLRSN